MFIVNSYTIAVILCVVTMLCWGSWANTLKMSPKGWEFPLYYWDYSLGTVLLALIFGLTLGNIGEEGRGFFEDLVQADTRWLGSAFLGGIIFNLSNLLIVAATAIAGMAVAFPLAVGLALVIGVVVNFIAESKGDPLILFIGVGLVVVAIVVNAIAYRKLPSGKGGTSMKGILISILSGIIMGFFFRFVAASMSMNFTSPEAGKMTPYTAVFVFSLGLFISNFIWNTFFMYRPVEGEPVTYADYFKKGNLKIHLIGLLGGIIWNIGMSFSLIAAEQAGPAISYGLGQGATMIAAAWGVFIWKEFKEAPRSTNWLLFLMFLFFISGLMLVIIARNV
ncbi:MAG: multidrug DMT transporter permease [Bacteroides sp. SM23_62_1]|nr:MAG: multidrug DMT transporter permease [Bacteroides sp. SM23_62_1]